MALEEKISKHLGIPYVYLPEQKKFLCSNGVIFTLEEHKKGIDINAEYERREKEDKLYDYAYAKSTGLLRKKRGMARMESSCIETDKVTESTEEKIEQDTEDRKQNDISVPEVQLPRNERLQDNSKTVTFICLLLLFTSLISGYISTLHTATYLYAYVDVFSAWLMSASVTAYNATAFEVAVVFKTNKRYMLSLLFITLWGMVTLFSMTTTISVFYDRFNFTETQIAMENRNVDSGKLALVLLKTKEADIRQSIDFKKKDIEYRQERDYATTAVRLELERLQSDLQVNLSEQQKLLSDTPEITEKINKRKESLFSFLGRMLRMEGGILEFTMSTLSAVFVNLICPFSLIAVAELKKKRLTE